MTSSNPDPLELLRDHELRATSQRIEIMAAIVDEEGHPTAEEVWERARQSQPTLSLSTVYDTLARFVDIGVIDEVHAGEGATRYEFFHAPHVNLVCTECGDVEDVDVEGVEAVIERAAEGSQFDVHAQPLELEGVCTDCTA